MSGVDPSFEALLARVLSHDNATRQQAEQAYNQRLETQPALVVQQLLCCLENGQVMIFHRWFHCLRILPDHWKNCMLRPR